MSPALRLALKLLRYGNGSHPDLIVLPINQDLSGHCPEKQNPAQ
jgi:hypothetical protein